MTTMRRIAPVAAMLALVLAACTDRPDPNNGIASANGGGVGPTSAGASPPADAAYDGVKLAKCLRDQGIPADDPGPGQEKPQIPESVSKEQIDAAMEHCKQFAPDYGKTAPPLDAATLEQLRKFAQCMREQGVDSFPDPGPTGFPRPGVPPQDRDKLRQQAAAMKVCAEKVPEAGISIDPGDGPKVENK
jgi:hypothetical protein